MAIHHQTRRNRSPSTALALVACAVAWQAGVSQVFVAATWRSIAHARATAVQSYTLSGNPQTQSSSFVASTIPRHASEKMTKRDTDQDEAPVPVTVKPRKKQWQQPWPKYIIGGALLFGTIGFAGGGAILMGVFGLAGAGLGMLFEPYQLSDGSISGLD
mmetsp:Transcript_120667/g.240276  ORF Transcript_120667/g.240276 Transcript_120667/m.240276 type:complete len:159 (-) Transcript_120667:55-531(-)